MSPLISEKIEVITPYTWQQVGHTKHFILCPTCGREAPYAYTRDEAIRNARERGWLVEDDGNGNVKVECNRCNVERR